MLVKIKRTSMYIDQGTSDQSSNGHRMRGKCVLWDHPVKDYIYDVTFENGYNNKYRKSDLDFISIKHYVS